jgi:hypothetical protein
MRFKISSHKSCKYPTPTNLSQIYGHLPKDIHNLSILSFSNIEIAKATPSVSVLVTMFSIRERSCVLHEQISLYPPLRDCKNKNLID